MLPKSITAAKNLVTSREATCTGFLEQARAKGRRASPYVKEALNFWDMLQKAKTAEDLLKTIPISTLATACGFSDKSQGYFTQDELRKAIGIELAVLIKGAGERWREELLYRYLLTRGDTLGGEMRNVTGAMAQRKFTSALIKVLRRKNIAVQHEEVGEKITRISWDGRVIVFDRKPRVLNNSVDIILIKKTDGTQTIQELLEEPACYLACGELKGGIDPAGADEHWKTASGALSRIRERLGERCPNLFFVGAAIESSMAREIFEQLQSGKLACAANLTVDTQLEELMEWLVSL